MTKADLEMEVPPITVRQLSMILDVAVVSLYRILKSRGFPDGPEDKGQRQRSFFPKAVGKWLKEYYLAGISIQEDGTALDPVTERARWLHYKANNEQLAEQKTRGETMTIDEAIQAYGTRVTAAKIAILNVGAMIRTNYPQLDPEIVAEIDEMHREALNMLSEGVEISPQNDDTQQPAALPAPT